VGGKLSGGKFRDEDIQTIVGEVEFLVRDGYRRNDGPQILDGLKIALETSTTDEWKRWTQMKLMHVINDLYDLGRI
jgi:hypothetical protein